MGGGMGGNMSGGMHMGGGMGGNMSGGGYGGGGMGMGGSGMGGHHSSSSSGMVSSCFSLRLHDCEGTEQCNAQHACCLCCT